MSKSQLAMNVWLGVAILVVDVFLYEGDLSIWVRDPNQDFCMNIFMTWLTFHLALMRVS
jgi:hypothetical protein